MSLVSTETDDFSCEDKVKGSKCYWNAYYVYTTHLKKMKIHSESAVVFL